MKKKPKTSRFKIQRRLLTELPGLGKAGALERKPYPPGQHGARRIKYSDYRLQLEEKQKIRFHYGLDEKQLLRFVKNAKSKAKQGKWIDALVNLLEKRLDNILFRAGITASIPAAKQLVSHGKVLVNGRKVDIRSFIVKVGDKIDLKPEILTNQVYLMVEHTPRLSLPSWLDKNATTSSLSVTLKDEPHLDAVPFAFDEGLVTSYYSKA